MSQKNKRLVGIATILFLAAIAVLAFYGYNSKMPLVGDDPISTHAPQTDGNHWTTDKMKSAVPAPMPSS